MSEKESQKLLTIAIPTYNMEKYLNQCLSSFIIKEDMNELEVIIVNDGSKDKSLEIARSFEKKYPNIFKVIDKENGGHGSGINYGLANATGKYFKVVDADDWVDTEALKKTLEFLSKTDVDLVLNNFIEVWEGKTTKTVQRLGSTLEEYKTYDLTKETFDNNQLNLLMHTCIWKTANIKNKFKIVEKCFYVDVLYNFYCFSTATTFAYINVDLYQYRLGRIGQSVSMVGYGKHADNHATVTFKTIEFYEKTKLLNENYTNRITQTIKRISNLTYVIYLYAPISYNNKIIKLKEYDKNLKNSSELFYNEFNSKYHKLYIKSIRKHNFKNIKFWKFIHKLKHMF